MANLRMRTFACAGAFALLLTRSAVAADDPAALLNSLCTKEAMDADAALAQECKAARLAALAAATQAVRDGALASAQANAATAESNASAKRKAELEAEKLKFDAIKSALAVDPNMLNAIKPGQITVANKQTFAGKYLLSDGAKAATARQSEIINTAVSKAATSLTACKPGAVLVVLADEPLQVSVANYSIAQDAITNLESEARSIGAPAGGNAATVQPGKRFDSALFGLTSGIAGAGLAVDLIGKTAALVASFRPSFAYGSETDDDFEALVAAHLRGSLVTNLSGATLVSVSDALPRLDWRRSGGADSVRARLEALLTSTDAMRTQYGATGGTPDQRTRLGALLKATEDLKARLLLGQVASDGKTPIPPLMQSFDQIDGAKLTSDCLLSLRTSFIAAGSDVSSKQPAFGSQIDTLLVYGSVSWQLTDAAGRLFGSGLIQTDAKWVTSGAAFPKSP